jgi:mono/diheme cytochrome c family protein
MKPIKRVVVAAVMLGAVATACAQPPGTPTVDRGQAAFKNQGCYGCHLIGKFGTPIGPDLSHVGSKYPEAYLARWLRDPALQRPNAHMPALELTEADVQALAAYLGSLR